MNGANLDDLVDLLGRWASGRGPLYLLLAARLRALIDDGVLGSGAQLPPDRMLAERLAVGRGTVVSAYDLLQQEGRVVRRQGSGTRVAEMDAAPSANKEVIPNPLLMHILNPPDNVRLLTCAAPEEPPAILAEAYHHAASTIARTRHDLGYQPAGHPLLREAIAASYRRRGLPTSAEQIIVTTGAQQALTLLTTLLVSPGDTVLTESPTYPGALEVFRQASAVIRPVDTDPLSGALRGERPALLYVIPTASNPGGAIMDTATRRHLAGQDFPVIDDEVCAELCFDGEVPPPLAAFDERAITISSMSKSVWGGMRVGWVRAPTPLVSRLARLRAIHDLGGEVASQLAAAWLLERMEEVRRSRIELLKERHDHLCRELAAHLPDWEFRPAMGGQTLWVRIPRGDVDAFAQLAQRHGVAIAPGRGFDPLGAAGDRMRLHFLFAREELSAAVRDLARAWAAYDGSAARSTRHALIV
ncbi:PLP-dependent aminotransferase family protein [Nonomuraea soli]|uniref:DNA-binding transcriptional MocR family regulator n=1 Tax=Nonomuraea soli TaxID=1032476 RepID=A0A7W0HN17_9ACTN|nr:PLP-dependent aminotransferase family protein [Nonomuraea soli]MBA2889360.1 DNA-binding transcriptional MocR family regulator [Nonomuraea soli]